MDAWLSENRDALASAAPALAGAVALLLVVGVVATVLLRRERARRQAAEEERTRLRLLLAEAGGRSRIVRELHEIAARSVTLIATQAEGARFAGSAEPEVAVRAASAIEQLARTTLADLRRAVGVAGESAEGDDIHPPSFDEMIEAARGDALVIEVEERGRAFPLDDAAALGIVRIVHEALGNARRHGGPGTRVRVSRVWTDDGLQLKVDDDGARASSRRDGLDPDTVARHRGYTIEDDLAALTRTPRGPGLRIMRERAEALGGVFSATRVPGVGFSVSVVLPTIRVHNGIHGVDLGRAASTGPGSAGAGSAGSSS